MQTPSRPWWRSSGTYLVLAAAAGSTALLLFPPEEYSFYPRCPVYETFGLLCPGCGGTRAVAALLRGHVREALGWNALVALVALLSVPLAGAYAVASVFAQEQALRARLGCRQRVLATAGLLIACLFTVWRNR